MRRALLAFAFVIAISFAVALAAAGDGDSSRPTAAAEPTAAQPAAPIEVDQLAMVQAFSSYVTGLDVARYVEAVRTVQITEYVASIPPPPPVEIPAAPSLRGGTGGAVGSCGGATNGADQFIARESGGNPNALNPSGAWGCYQIMPGTWAGAGCDELGAYGSAPASVQAACASRLSLSAWNL